MNENFHPTKYMLFTLADAQSSVALRRTDQFPKRIVNLLGAAGRLQRAGLYDNEQDNPTIKVNIPFLSFPICTPVYKIEKSL